MTFGNTVKIIVPSKVLLVLSCAISLFCSGTTFAAQARGLMWKYSHVTDECLDPDGDGKNMTNILSWEDVEDWESVMDDSWSNTTLDYDVYARQITDDGKCSWGDDDANVNLDAGDATFFTSHGANKTTYFRVRLSSDAGNGGPDTCGTRTTHMYMGNDDAEFVHIGACHSGDYDLFTQSQVKAALAPHLHQYGGFHGEWWVSGNEGGDDFAEEGLSTTSGLSWAFIETFVEWNVHGSDDNCPMSLVQGTSQSNATTRKDYEDYNPTQYVDPEGEWTKYHFYCNCDPSANTALTCG